MLVQVKPELFDDFVRIELTGCPTLKQVLYMIDGLHNASRRWRGRPLMLVLSGMATPPSPVVRMAVGAYIAKRLSHIARIASVVPEGARTGDSERAARREGGNLRVFTSEAEAAAWLRGGEAA